MSDNKFYFPLFEQQFIQKPVASITNTPPGAPTSGSLVIVGTSPAGGTDFEGHANEYAFYYDSAWNFYTPVENQIVMLTSTGTLYIYKSGNWGAM